MKNMIIKKVISFKQKMLREQKKCIDPKLESVITDYKVSCSCGHKIFLGRKNQAICTWCGNYVFKDNLTEFKIRMKAKIREARNN